MALLSVRDLTVSFETEHGTMRAVNGVSFDLEAGEVIGIVGESGSGKSVASQTILRLVPSPPSFIERGEILFQGQDLAKVSLRDMRRVRGKDIAVIFQEPMTSLNPLLKVGTQVMEPVILHEAAGARVARAKALQLLEMVGFAHPERIIDEYPHRLSGGMRQRVMIAMALACKPKILIADEPTTALDATIQAQIFEVLMKLRHELNMAVILITHDLGVVADIADKVMVMYCGSTMESAAREALFSKPLHPYTHGLLRCVPHIGAHLNRLNSIEGTVPNAYAMSAGCAFHPRCPVAVDRCRAETPNLREVLPGHTVSCHLAGTGVSYA